jgi:hypothetical protein
MNRAAPLTHIVGVGFTEEIGAIISNAIRTAFVGYPTRTDGSQWDQTYKEPAECQMLANAVPIALNKSGFAITKVLLGRFVLIARCKKWQSA